MRNKLKYILVAGLGISMLASCNRDNLSPTPDTSISDASAFDQPYRIAAQVLTMYSTMKGGTYYGGRFVVYGDIRADDFLSEDPNLVTNADVWQLNATNTASAIVGLWGQAYLTINNCNLFIDGMNAKGLSVVGPAIGNAYIAEARLIRAIAYYSLLQHYARPFADGAGSKLGLPLRLTGIKGPGASNLARSTVAEIYTQILADLDFAETNLPLTNGATAYNNVTRAHRNTAIAFKTRVNLSKGDYAKVITEANKIVPATAPFVATSGVAHALQADITNVFKAPYTTTESIFSMPFTTNAGDIPGTQNGLQGYYYASATGTGSIFSLNPAGIIADAGWTAVDKRRSFIYTNPNPPNKKYLTKFPIAAPADYTPVIRWAEVLLNLAEARVRTTNVVDPQAVALLNAVRNRSDATTVFTVASFANATALIDAILKERRIEFLGEGLRNNDDMRLLRTLPAKGVVGAKTPGDEGYIWPVSNLEKSLNTLWVD
jgi:starch-binding outer membrane protein, SusD/RagB family